ncbi:hypothetical protein [Mucilaginibacter gotjawali]|uniref:Uncharacterized protein n=2 Tax=Mucilaginibacter gotjawali TaxID=1550579 RepID=A0A110AZZ0_9SPHI|nr:hypothetical protein [Mucilaginibacter gotjawali]MBB3058071.1 hypothetical protein [Mucilaginibacter gotjawali]BAU52046.1 hypothetical protein MgSA37_00196 [Mucilaginibacter gotjawali]
MNKILTTLLICSALCGCKGPHEEKQHSKDHSKTPVQKEASQTILSFGQAVQIDTSAYLMFPLEIKHDDNSFKSRGGSYQWNIVFLNTQTQQYHLLDSTRKMLIREYSVDQSSNDNTEENSHNRDEKHIYYSVTVNDANKNGVLDDADPVYLFISDRTGNNFRQISPENYTVESWKLIKETNKVLMYAVGREHMNEGDDKMETTPFIYDLKTNNLSKPVFSNRFIQTTKQLFDKNWHEE